MSNIEKNKDNEAIAAAEALGAAMKARNPEQVAAIYADDIVVWHGSTRQAQTKAENIALLSQVFKVSGALEYIEIKRFPIEGGVVQQHRLVGTFDDGKPMPSLEACLVIHVKNGLITRIDEYFDGAQYAEVWERLAGLS